MGSGQVCLRCGEELPHDGMAYCATCAAPQLRITAEEIDAAAAQLGEQPPIESLSNQPDWKRGYAACVTAASAAGLLSSLLVFPLNALFMLWALAGAVLAVVLYMRKVERAQLSGTIGARLGLVTGCMASAGMLSFSALFLVLQRFAFGNGWKIDRFLTEQLRQVQIQMAASSTPAETKVLELLNTPDWRAGLVLGYAVVLVVIMVLFSTVAGAASGKFLAMRQRVQRFRRL